MTYKLPGIIDPSPIAVLLMALLSVPSLAEQLVPAQTVGISAERLQRVATLSQRYVDEGRVAGMVTPRVPPWQAGAGPGRRRDGPGQRIANADGYAVSYLLHDQSRDCGGGTHFI